MSFSLKEAIKSSEKKIGIQTAPRYPRFFSSGLDVLDVFNSHYYLKDPANLEDEYFGYGFPFGKISLITGKTGAGKTTLAVQSCINGMKPYGENALTIHYDLEDAYSVSRAAEVSGLTETEIDIYYDRKLNATSEQINNYISALAEKKIENAEHLKVVGPDGEPMMTPTAVIIDTVSRLHTDGSLVLADEGAKGTMATPLQRAKMNNWLLSSSLHLCQRANIALVCVNHINEKISDKGPPAKELLNLKQGETVTGGKDQMQLADFWLTVKGVTRLDPALKFKTEGMLVEATMIKSRAGWTQKAFNLVYRPQTGFDNILTNAEFLAQKKVYKGSPRAYHLEYVDEETGEVSTSKSFTLGQIVELYKSDADFSEFFQQVVEKELINHIHGA